MDMKTLFYILIVFTILTCIFGLLLAIWTIDSVNRRKKGKPERKLGKIHFYNDK